ncbi:MAG: hypothetical protein JWM43_2732 [Acidobacteriaceae bacterium]|nr:hypothetical protein [Acidobacteriaceae bacterium]
MARSSSYDPAKALRKALHRTRAHPAPEQVHAIRSQIRRVLAQLRLLPDTPYASRKLRRFTRATKPLIHAAGKVRDLDIQLDLLAALPRDPALQPAIGSLSRTLTGKRGRQAAKLQEFLEDRRSKLKELLHSLDLETVLPGPAPTKKQIKDRAVADFLQATVQLNPHEPDDLHLIRKAARDARYLLEAHSPENPSAAARHFHRLQQQIGEWHDWLTLTDAAQRHLPALSPLLPALAARRDERHQDALKLLSSTARRQKTGKT